MSAVRRRDVVVVSRVVRGPVVLYGAGIWSGVGKTTLESAGSNSTRGVQVVSMEATGNDNEANTNKNHRCVRTQVAHMLSSLQVDHVDR